MKINNLQSSLAAKIKFEASSRLSWGESHQVLYHAFPALSLNSPPTQPPPLSLSLCVFPLRIGLLGQTAMESWISHELL